MNKVILSLIILAAGISACGDKEDVTSSNSTADTVVAAVADTPAADTISAADTATVADEEYATYYLAIADTGKNYQELDRAMYALNKNLKLEVDTMNRYYNAEKKRIVLNENDEDEMYRGEYFPRRFPAENLSLEYLDMYDDKAQPDNIALVAGIYESQAAADSMLSKLRPHRKEAYTLKAKVYIGCMH